MDIMKKSLIAVLYLIIMTGVQAQNANNFQERLIKYDTELSEKLLNDDAGVSVIITHKNKSFLRNIWVMQILTKRKY